MNSSDDDEEEDEDSDAPLMKITDETTTDIIPFRLTRPYC